MANNKVLVTTTSIQNSIKIEHYKGIVSARVVTGVDLFSDIIASFSDVFGGRSATYQKQLKSIYDEVMELLKDEALKKGANAIVGVKIDHDEVSGKGKQMFMVTATGTAAFIPGYDQPFESASLESKDEITLERYRYEYNRLNLIYRVNQDYNVIPNDWQAIFEYYPPEIMEQVFKLYYANPIDYSNTFANVYQYFAGLDETRAKTFLYDQLRVNGKAMTIIHQAQLIDYDLIERMLATDSDWIVKKYALALVTGDKRNYHAKDVDQLEKLIDLIQSTFVQRAKHEADRWTCECGRVNKSKDTYCKSCEQDDKGFKKGEVGVEETLSKLKEKVYVLKNILGRN